MPEPSKQAEEKFLVIKKNWCKRCGICVAICPKKVIDRMPDGSVEVIHLEWCISCGLCVLHCPDFAIFGDPDEFKLCEDR